MPSLAAVRRMQVLALSSSVAAHEAVAPDDVVVAGHSSGFVVERHGRTHPQLS